MELPAGRKEWLAIDSGTERAVAQDDLTPEELIRAIEESLKEFNGGDLGEGEVVTADRDEVLLAISYMSECVIPSKELSIREHLDPSESGKFDDQTNALIHQ